MLSRTRNNSIQHTAFIVCILSILPVSCSRGTEQPADCSIDRGSCTKLIGKTEVIFDISPKPVKVMKELLFSVTVKSTKIKAPLLLVLSMPGMYMGRNEVVLKQGPDGTFTGRGIIPRCPAGKKKLLSAMGEPLAA